MTRALSKEQLTALLSKHQSDEIERNLDGVSFNRVTCLPKRVEEGSIFFCVPGETRDSSTPFEEALRNGAACIISEEGQKLFPEPEITVPHIKVKGAREAFADFSATLFGNPSEHLRLIGVTGTNGKTTITHLIEHIFRHAKKRIGLIGTLGFRLPERDICDFGHTTPPAGELQEVLAQMKDVGCSHVSLEVTSHALVFRRVGSCHFAIAVLSNISQDHLDFHGTMENYWRTKLSLFESLHKSIQKNKAAIINIDEELAPQFLAACGDGVRRITYGFSPKADVHVLSHRWKDGMNHVQLSAFGDQFDFSIGLPGRFNLYNAMAAIAVCLHEGLSTEQIFDAFKDFKGVPGRFERISTGAESEPLCIVDFAHSPDALEKVLKTLRELNSEGGERKSKLICVFGCAGESDAGKRPLMGAVAEKFADQVILTNSGPGKENPGDIVKNIISGMTDTCKVEIELDRFAAIKKAIHSASSGDAVLIAGQGHYQFQHIGDKEVAIDDRIEAQKALLEWRPSIS